MKDEKKSKTMTNYPVGFCLLLVVVFLTVSFQTTAREKPVFIGNSRLFNQYGDDNGLFSQDYLSGLDRSNQPQVGQIKDKPRVSGGKLFGEIFMGMLGNVGGGFLGGLVGNSVLKVFPEKIGGDLICLRWR